MYYNVSAMHHQLRVSLQQSRLIRHEGQVQQEYLSQQKTTAGHYALQAVKQKVWMREQREERKDRERIDRQACYLLVFCRRWQLQRRLDLTTQLCRQTLHSLINF